MNFKLPIKLNLILFALFLTLTVKANVFNTPRQIALPTAQTAVATGDLNKDGLPDLIMGGVPLRSENGKIRVLLGKGNGNFHPFKEYVVGFNSYEIFQAPFVQDIITGDLNADGNLDVVVAHNERSDQFSRSPLLATILFGDGRGNLQVAPSYSFFSNDSNNYVTTIDFTDFNRDGQMDVVLGGFGSSSSLGRIFGLQNMGGGRFQPIGPKIVGAMIFKMQAAFVNEDANPDLIMTTPRGIIILYGDGGFYGNDALVLDEEKDVNELVVKDFNNDGKPDIAVTESFNPNLHLFLSGKAGYPTNPVIYKTEYISFFLRSADINSDGKDDLVIVNGVNGEIEILYGDGNGNFGSSETINNNLPTSDLTFADFDTNGKVDIATSLYDSSQSSFQAAVFLNAPNPIRYFTDFDRDGKSDISVFRPESGVWHLQQSQSGYAAPQFGLATDKLIPADYDGDGKTDLAVFRENPSDPGKAKFFILQSSNNQLREEQLGSLGDIPVAGDWDGDGRFDVGVYRSGTEANQQGYFYYRPSSQPAVDFIPYPWGISGDKPVVADYDGDGKADPAVFRPSTGGWFVQRSRDGFYAIQFGAAEDKPVVGDYDGDGKADQAVFRPSNGVWYIWNSSTGFSAAQFGISTDKPVPADYDGDGKTDVAVYRDGNWFLLNSTNGFTAVGFGTATDKPVPNSFVP